MFRSTRFLPVIAAVITLFAGPALACQFDTDCEVGSHCVKQRGELDGYCAGGLYPGNDNDRRPYSDPLDITESVGDTCSFDTDCGVGARCAKRAGQIHGVCVQRR